MRDYFCRRNQIGQIAIQYPGSLSQGLTTVVGMTLIGERLNGSDQPAGVVVAAADLDRALSLLDAAEQARSEAAELLGPLAECGLAQWLGYVSMERLVAHRTRSGNSASSELLRVARHLNRFPLTGAALGSGEISWAVAEVLARTADGVAASYLAGEAALLAAAVGQEPAEVERRCRLWRAQVDPESFGDEAERAFARRGMWMQFAFDGSCNGRFALDSSAAEAVWAAVDSPPDPVGMLPEPRSAAQRRADKLVEVCEGSLGWLGEASEGGGGGRTTVDVVIDVETLVGTTAPLGRVRAELNHGGSIAGPGLDRLLCDASFRSLVTDGPDIVLRYNRATPDIPPGLRRAVRVRDRSCTFAGCDRPWNWCDLHHIVPRSRGGPTTAENLTLLCRFHHGCVHEGRWQLSRAPDGSISVTSP